MRDKATHNSLSFRRFAGTPELKGKQLLSECSGLTGWLRNWDIKKEKRRIKEGCDNLAGDVIILSGD